MGRAIHIDKIKEKNDIYYYEVADDQPNKTRFFIAIDALKKTISYFLTSECDEPIAVINFNVDDKIIPVPPFDKGTAEGAFLSAGFQAYLAIKNNSFPDHIGKYS